MRTRPQEHGTTGPGHKTAVASRAPSTLSVLRKESGVALVITLIMLAVITFMAVTFLVVTRGEHNNTQADTDQTTGQMAADSGLQAALAQAIANITATTNPWAVGMSVSTNYISAAGFIKSGPGYTSFTNVSYTYPDGTGLKPNDFLQNLANLRYLPRAPVYVTNRTAANSNDLRYYVDINRNGRDDPSGWLPVISTNPALPYFDLNWNLVSVSNNINIQHATFMGDPQWIGLLERPSYPPALYGVNAFPQGYGHSSSNRFVGRYAFVIIPSSLTLDINTLHNYAKGRLIAPNGNMSLGDGFLRDMGVGTFENNMASFLSDLNTNYWPPVGVDTPFGFRYQYNATNATFVNTGAAFDDATGLLRYRYGGTNWLNSSASVRQLFGASGAIVFRNDLIDGYASGPVMTTFHYPTDGDNNVLPTFAWPGAESRNRFFDSQEFFDPVKSPQSFVARLKSASSQIDSYNRYTFYRMLMQLGTDSAPEHGKINVNYNNMVAGQVVPDRATNMAPWNPLEFFTNAAIRMFTQAGFDQNVVSNGQIHIQIYPTNYYFPSVHRMLQVAANIYDFTTNNQATTYPFCPSVFRPVFSEPASLSSNSPVYITGYVELTDDTFVTRPPVFHELANPFDRRGGGGTNVMYYGVPLVIGAKKGFPNFNGFSLQSDTMITRKLVFGRDPVSSKVNSTNQAYSIGISNVYGIEAWNSYMSNYPRQLQIYSRVEIGMGLSTNRTDFVTRPNGGFQMTNYTPPFVFSLSNTWAGSALQSGTFQPAPASFSIPIHTNWVFLPTNIFQTYARHLTTDTNANDGNGLFPVPHLLLNVTSRVRFALVDTSTSPHRIVDYANLLSIDPPVDLMDLCQRPQPDQPPGNNPRATDPSTAGAAFFATNRVNNVNNDSAMTYGVLYQLLANAGGLTVDPVVWNAFKAPGAGSQSFEVGKFRNRLLAPQPGDPLGPFQAAFNPYRVIHHYVSWQVNDPLVHYIVPDLLDGFYGLKTNEMDQITQNSPMPNLGRINRNYRPWAVNGESSGDTSPGSKFNIGFKDSLVGRSDDWDWPTNKSFKFPTVGWIGQVHRGTPWQTIDFKAPVNVTVKVNADGSTNSAPDGSWGKWAVHDIQNWDGFGNERQDSTLTDPTNDYRFVDLFTTAFNDSSTRGQLSINQPGLAAWSAVMGGVVVATSTNGSYSVIEPAGIYNPNPASASSWPALYKIVNGINRTRTNVVPNGTNGVVYQFQNGTYQHLGDILNVPELTTISPLLPTNAAGKINTNIISDAVYERLPQQTLNLLRGGDQPRFVIYAFGQGLRPAPNSLITASGPYYQMCTNYAVTSEVAARAVVRVEGSADPANANNPNPANRYPPRLVMESYNILPPY